MDYLYYYLEEVVVKHYQLITQLIRSKYFVMTNYIVKVNIGDKTNTMEKTLKDGVKMSRYSSQYC